MKLSLKTGAASFLPSDTVAFFLPEKKGGVVAADIPEPVRFIADRIDLSLFRGKSGETLFLPLSDMPNTIIIGLGKPEDVSPESLRNIAGNCITACKKKKITEIHLLIPPLPNIAPSSALSCVAEGVYLTNYNFEKYKSKKDIADNGIRHACFYSDAHGADAILKEIGIVCENTLRCRDLVNETSDRANPVAIADEAKKIAKLKGVACRIFGKKDIERMKMGLFLAVNRGSDYPPRLVVMRYRGNPRSGESTALVGKGITFDSGGMNLKSSGNIEAMRSDMAGAAAVLYAFRAAVELKLPANLFAVVPLTENMLAARSYRPGDIYTAYNGKTVEIGNTDAEGRLILADAIAYTVDRLKPTRIVDIATLTGACTVTFGEIVAGMLSTDDDTADRLFRAGEATGERLWRLPLYREYEDDIKSEIADMANVSSKKQAGTIIGAVFLKSFTRKIPWAHIDIAGTAWYSKRRGYSPRYATGFGVRLFVEFLKQL